ncbi:MAG: T9SS type A sorting domain-containing protein [Bacteroidia bacterium]
MNTTFYKNTTKLFVAILALLLSERVSAQVSAYNFTQTTASYTALSGGTVVATATGTSGAASLDDVIYDLPAGTMPFTFTYDNVGYTGCKISTNGFITFGTTAPSASGTTTGYVPLSATTAYSGAASPIGRNLNAYYFAGVPSQTGEIRYQTLGSSPNRTFVIQWTNFKTFNTSGATYGPVLNFQVRLSEGSNAIAFVYNCSGNFSSSTAQVGLRGATNAFPSNINNRSVASGTNTWITSAAGTANTSTCEFSGTLLPPVGLTYTFAPASCPAPLNPYASNITQNAANLYWTSGGGSGTYTIEYGLAGFAQGSGTSMAGVSSGVAIASLASTTNYQFYVRQNCGGNGNSSWVGPINFSTGGPGEDCATAINVSVASSLANCSYTVVNSGVSSNGPNAICSDANGNGANDDKWYKFTAPSNGSKLVITTTAGTVNDWVMEVWSGCPGNGSMMQCSDDVNGAMPEIQLCQNQYTAGQVYYVRIWTYSTTAVGTCNLCVYKTTACPLPPVNDECISAIRLTVNPPLACPASATTQTTANATPNTDAATCDAGTKRDVWFVFNTGNFGDIRMTINPVTATSLKAQLMFECGGFEINCYNPANGTYTFTGLNPQADYIIRVWSDSGAAGTFNICLSDICSNPTASWGANQTICTGTTASLPVNFTGVPPFTFTYKNNSTNQNTVINTSSNPYLLQLTPTATTTYSLVSMSDAACSGTATGTASVTVVNPQSVALLPFTPVCENITSVNLTGGSPAGGVYSGTGVSGTTFNTSSGSQTITYTVTFAPGCSGSASQLFTVNPLPNVVLNPLGNVCSTAAPFTLTTGTPSGGTYTGTGITNNVFSPSVAGLGTKVITYAYTSTAGCTNTDTSTITVITCVTCSNPPTANAGPDKTSCNGADVSMAGSFGGGANSSNWSSTGTGTFSPNITSLTATYTPSAADLAAGFVFIVLTTNDPDGSGPCVAARDTMKITYLDQVALVNITGTTGVCRPVNGVSYSVSAQAGVNYAWTVPTNVAIASGQGTSAITANWPSNGQAGNVCVTASNVCNSVQSCINVKLRSSAATAPGTVKGFTTVCRNETLKYSCSRVSSADYYLWTPPVGATINGSSSPFSTVDTFVVVTFGSTFAGDTLRVQGGNCKGLSVQKKVRINRRTTAPATPSAIQGQAKGVCNSKINYNVSLNAAAVTYTWRTTVAGALINNLPSPVTTTDTIVSIEWPLSATGGTLYVKANNACGSSAERSLTIATIPATPTSISGKDTVCAGASGNYSTPLLAGATSYTWTVPTSVTIQSGQGTDVVSLKFNTTTGIRAIKVKANNSCGSSYNFTKNVLAIACPRLGEVSAENMFEIDAYPNPTSELLNIIFNSSEASDYNVVLLDLSGRVVRSERVSALEGMNSMVWDMSTYQSGTYILTILGEKGKSQLRIVVE